MRNTLLKLYQNQIFIWFCYLIVASLLYVRVIGNFFASDDFHWLSLAKSRPWEWSIFLTNYAGTNIGGSYNPLLFVIWKIAYWFFSLHYQWYHVVSIFLHATNAWLVYILAKNLFSKYQVKAAYWASLCGLFFLIWPVQIEAISWIAAWPHLWATLFYLLSLIFYITFLTTHRKLNIILSLVFFATGIFVKEIVMTLPVAIVVLDFYFSRKISLKKIWPYFLFLFVFLGLRWQATGLLIGYYGQASLGIKINEYLGNLAIMFLNWPSSGYFQVIFYKVWYHYSWLLASLTVIFLAGYLFYLWRYKKQERLLFFSLLVLSCLPVLPLGLHRTTFAGERYLYLPTAFFVIWFIALLAELKLTINKKMAVVFFIALCSLVIINDKNIIWSKAAKLSQGIVTSYHELGLEPGVRLVSVALPDNLQGAEVFRNNLQQALELYYPDAYPQISPLPVYIQLKGYNKNYHLLRWRPDEKGWFLESVDRSFVVTGLTSIVVNQVYFELWHYNYQNYTADLIRLMPEPELLSQLRQGTVKWLSFDRGKLMVID